MPTSSDFLREKNYFIEKVREAISSGSGMNPLVGSGASAASGIIMGLEFSDYLAHVVQLATMSRDAWDLRRNGWPSYPTTESYENVRVWTLREFKQFTNTKSGVEVVDDGRSIKRISPKTNSFSEHLNCPDPPANIRSSDYVPFDPSLIHLNVMLRSRKRKADRYEPLWLKPEQSPTSSDWIREIGVRSLSDWRATLRFISRLKKERSGRVILSRPDRSVIDRFNTFITADRQPNLAHKMLAALARPLRMRAILTTNFDTLLEDAFLQSGHYLKKFFVSRFGRLPDPFLVRAQPSIIKVHGELLETRADFSLDSDPALFDKRRFFRYFVDTKSGREQFQSMMSHVLVLGYSGNDIRTIRMLQYLLDETAHFQPDSQPKIFWICVTEGDVWRVNTFFSRYPKDRIIACRTDRPDLLLLELYQKVVRAIPVAGQTYEYNHNVPPWRASDALPEPLSDSRSQSLHIMGMDAFNRLDAKDTGSIQNARDSLAHVAADILYRRFRNQQDVSRTTHPMYEYLRIRNISQLVYDLEQLSPAPFSCRLWIHVYEYIKAKRNKATGHVIFFETACGALEALSHLQSQLARTDAKRCMWFELADYINSDALLRDVLRSIALRTGRFQREHVTLHPLSTSLAGLDSRPDAYIDAANALRHHLDGLCRINNLTPADWPVLIYGRDLAGSCVGWQSGAWNKPTWDQLCVLIGALAMAGFPVLLAHSSIERMKGEEDKWNLAIASAEEHSGVPHPQSKYIAFARLQDQVDLPDLFRSGAKRDSRLSTFAMMREAVFQRCLHDVGFRKFVFAACQFRQSRRPSALFYEAVQPCSNRFNRNGIDNDARRAVYSEDAIRFLESQRVFYLKAGGSSWMHRDIRVALKIMLDHVPWTESVGRNKVQVWHSHSVGRVNFWIADWYEKAFLSTGFSKPVFEALHHYFQAARMAVFALPKGLQDEKSYALISHRFLLMRSALNAMAKLLLVGRPYLKLWIANLHGFPMFEIPVATPNGSDSNYDQLIKWLWPEPAVTHHVRGLNGHHKEELGRCFHFLTCVIRDTQRAIKNEADIHISPDIASVTLGLIPAERSTHKLLDGVLGLVYCTKKRWIRFTSILVNSIATDYGGPSNEIKGAYRSCLPIGKASAFIDEHEHAIHKGIAVAALGSTLERLPSLLAIIESIAYAQMRRAKFCGHTVSKRINDQEWRREDVRDEWLRVTRICNLGIDWCKHLSPAALKLDLELRVRLHSYYAVALANLDRFYEAHRHLTEALAIQSKHLWATPRIELAKLGLRRAEVILTEAHRVRCVLRLLARGGLIHKGNKMNDVRVDQMVEVLSKNGMCESIMAPSSPLKGILFNVEMHQSVRECLVVGNDNPTVVIEKLRRLLASMLDDAWFCIENAEKSLSGQSQSSLWWGRISLMKLRACGYQLNLWITSQDGSAVGEEQLESCQLATPALRMLAYRHRRISPQCMWQLFETARLNDSRPNENGCYREYRLVRYVAECLQVFIHCKDEVEFVREKCEDLRMQYLSPNRGNPKLAESKLSSELQNFISATKDAIRKALAALKPS